MTNREHATTLLSEASRRYDEAWVNRIRYIKLAREHGIPILDIAHITGMTERDVRAAVRHAEALD